MNKVSKESIEKKIVKSGFKRLSGKLTHCTLILENGFEVTGESACVDPANYNQEIGEKIAYENAFEKIWQIEGYLLQENIYLKKKLQQESGSLLLTACTQKIKEAFSKEYPVASGHAFFHNPAIANKKPYGEHLTNNEFNNHLNDLRKNCFNQDYKSHLSENKVTFSDGTVIKFEKMNSTVAHKIFDELLKETGFGSYTIRKMMFDKIFPDAPKMAYRIANGQVYVEKIDHLHTNNWEYDVDIVLAKQEPGNVNVVNAMPLDGVKVSYNKICKMVNLDIRDPNVREIIIKRMYPESTKSDFITLENSQAVTNELSFMKKYESLCLEKSKLVATGITNKTFNDFQTGLKNIILEELSNISKVLSSGVKTDEQKQVLAKLIEAKMWIVEYHFYVLKTETNNKTVEKTAKGLII